MAASLHARALAGALELTIDLADLVEDPAVRAGYSWDGAVDHHVTGPAPGDECLAPDAATRAFFEHEPQHVLVARDADGTPRGYSIAYPGRHRLAARARRPAARPLARARAR